METILVDKNRFMWAITNAAASYPTAGDIFSSNSDYARCYHILAVVNSCAFIIESNILDKHVSSYFNKQIIVIPTAEYREFVTDKCGNFIENYEYSKVWLEQIINLGDCWFMFHRNYHISPVEASWRFLVTIQYDQKDDILKTAKELEIPIFFIDNYRFLVEKEESVMLMRLKYNPFKLQVTYFDKDFKHALISEYQFTAYA